MTGRLLDTTVLIDLTRGASAHLSRRFAEAFATETPLAVSAISVFEFRYGAERSLRRDSQLAGLQRFLENIQVVDFDLADAEAAGRLKADLAARGQMIGAYDLLIGAQARVRGMAVVTGNVREFARIPGLIVEDWSRPQSA